MTKPAAPARQLTAFRFLVAGNMVSSFGNYLNMVALNLFVYQATGSAMQAGVFMALRLGAGFAAGLAGGTIAARLPRRVVMIGCDLAQAVVLVVVAVAGHAAQVALMPLVAVATGLLGVTSSVLLRSSVPDLVGGDHRVAANGLLVTGRAMAMAIGFATAGLLVGRLGYGAAFAVDAGTFVVSATVLALVPLSFRAAPAPPAPAEPGERLGYLARQRRALLVLTAAPMIGVIVLVRTVDAFGSASHNVGMPVYATLRQPGNPAAFMGAFFAVWAVGVFVAHRVVQRVRRGDPAGEARRSERGFIAGTCVMSAAFVLAFAGIPMPWVLPVALLAGLADGFTEITYTTRVQAEADPARGYVFGLTAMGENGGLGLGMLAAAALLEVWSPLAVTALMHGAVILLAAVVVALPVRRPARPVPSHTRPESADPAPAAAREGT